MKLHIRPITEQDASEVTSWRYAPPYDIYNLSPDEIPLLLDDANRYFAVYDGRGRLVGSCCFGAEARVMGGDYGRDEPEVLDVGVHMHSGLVGKGHGGEFVTAVLEFGSRRYKPLIFRATIAEFNQRSRRTFARLGFSESYRFEREGDGLPFVQVEKDAGMRGAS